MNEKKLALVFPGLGYGPDRPLLYYAGKLAREAGYELVTLSYGELPRVERPSPGKALDTERLGECFRLALERSASRLDGVLGKGEGAEEDSDILLISKSIGTAVGAAWAASHVSCLGNSSGTFPRQVLYTPVEKTFDFPLARSVAFHGTADPWIRTCDCEAGCSKAGVPLHLFDGANHSLECGDVGRDLEFLSKVMRITRNFINGEP